MNGLLTIEDNKQDAIIAWTVALLIHALFFTLTGKMFINPPQFAIAASQEIDINLIDAPKEIPQEIASSPSASRNDTSVRPRRTHRSSLLTQTKRQTKEQGILTSRGQVKVEAKRDYIQNPPPPYPELAKQMRQEGLVMLSVDVDMTGNSTRVEIIQSSGYRMLDQAALKAVRHWKFQPGSVGGIPIDSTVTIPIRFRLEK